MAKGFLFMDLPFHEFSAWRLSARCFDPCLSVGFQKFWQEPLQS